MREKGKVYRHECTADDIHEETPGVFVVKRLASGTVYRKIRTTRVADVIEAVQDKPFDSARLR